MFIIFGVHRNQIPLSTWTENCLYCHRPTPHSFIAVKKAAHLFWIPLIPFGAELYQKCGYCGNQWEINNAPLDGSFFAFFGFVALFFSIMVIGSFSGLCSLMGVLIIPAIAISLMYLFTVPPAYGHLRSEPAMWLGQMPSDGIPPYQQAVAPAQTTAADLYSSDYAARVAACTPVMADYDPTTDVNCGQCLRKYQVPSNSALAICPFCGAQKNLGRTGY